MKHHQLAALVAIADSGGFHAAARSLHLTQPAITRAVKDLEAELGTTLFVRQARGVVLTPMGQALLVRARLVVNEVRRAQEDVASFEGSRVGRLAVGLTPLAGLTILPKAFEQFRVGWPDVEVQFIEFTSDQLHERLRDGSLDFAVGAATVEHDSDDVLGEELLSLPTSFSVHRDSPLAGCRSLAELGNVEWLHADITRRFPAYLVGLFAEQGLPPPRRVTLCTSQALFNSLAMHNDVVFWWSLLAIGMPELRVRFVPLPLSRDLPRLAMRLFRHGGSPPTRAAAHFIQCIREVVRRDWAKDDAQ